MARMSPIVPEFKIANRHSVRPAMAWLADGWAPRGTSGGRLILKTVGTCRPGERADRAFRCQKNGEGGIRNATNAFVDEKSRLVAQAPMTE